MGEDPVRMNFWICTYQGTLRFTALVIAREGPQNVVIVARSKFIHLLRTESVYRQKARVKATECKRDISIAKCSLRARAKVSVVTGETLSSGSEP